MPMVFFCFGLVWGCLPISFRVSSLALGQSYDCPSAGEVILKDMGKITHYLTTTKHDKTWTLVFLWMCYIHHACTAFASEQSLHVRVPTGLLSHTVSLQYILVSYYHVIYAYHLKIRLTLTLDALTTCIICMYHINLSLSNALNCIILLRYLC